jgi:hypothetical protein
MPVHHHCDATSQDSSDAALGAAFLGFHANRHDLRRYEYGLRIPTIPYTQSGVFGRGVGGRVAADAQGPIPLADLLRCA